MYISKIRVKRGTELLRLTRSETRDSLYAAHQLLWKAFPKDADAERDFLFRQEIREGMPHFFVVSERRPINDELFVIETKEYSPQLAAGEQLAFCLKANPVIARKAADRKYSAKHDVWMDAKREAKAMELNDQERIAHCEGRARQWLVARGDALGFVVEPERISVDGYFQHQFYRRKGRPIRFSSINYNGVLTVADAERFLRTLYAGIGRSRAFGCGLLLVRRV